MADVAKQFVNYYYSTFDKDRNQLAPLYRQNSMLSFEGAETGGAPEIITKLAGLPFAKVKHEVGSMDVQPSANGALFVLVTGRLQVDEEGTSLGFSQAFHLIAEEGTYWVLNDIFRLVYG